MGYFGPMAFASEEMQQALDELLSDGELIKLEYTDPNSPTGRAKILLFVKGTTFLNLGELVNAESPNTEADLATKSNIDV